MLVQEGPADGAIALQTTRQLYSLAGRKGRGKGNHGLGWWLPSRRRTHRNRRRINGNSLRLRDRSDQFLHAGTRPLLIGMRPAERPHPV